MEREMKMDDELKKKKNKNGELEYVGEVQVVMLSFPIVGRTKPMFEFAKRLSSKPGILVSFATTAALAQRLHISPSGYGSLTISTLDDYNTDGFATAGSQNIDDYTDRFGHLAPLALSQLIAKLNNVRCLIYDSSQIWALPFARQLGLFAAPFFPQSCAVSLIFRHVFKGVLTAPPTPHPTRDDGLVVAPGLPPMSLGDFPSFVQQLGRFPLLEKLVLSQFQNFDDADWQFFNTFDALEDEVVKWMRKQWPSIMSIGPTIPEPEPIAVDMNSDEAADDACIQWLDNQADGSTLYVSFGSLAELEKAQMEELASAITNSGKPFLWVVSSSEESKLPKGFKDDLLHDRSQGEGGAKVKGLVVKWCPQLAVLAHRAVGCFFTHCGWNSTLEAISYGVPLVAMPQWADQPTNAMFVQQVWRVGIWVEPDPAASGLVTRDQIQACIREVMEGETGKELRSNATKLMLQAKAAIHHGGTSDRNIDDFVAKLLS